MVVVVVAVVAVAVAVVAAAAAAAVVVVAVVAVAAWRCRWGVGPSLTLPAIEPGGAVSARRLDPTLALLRPSSLLALRCEHGVGGAEEADELERLHLLGRVGAIELRVELPHTSDEGLRGRGPVASARVCRRRRRARAPKAVAR